MQFTACYTKLEEGFGYMGQLLEWPNVLTSGKDIEECKELLLEVAGEMADIYREDGQKIPHPSLIVESIDVPVDEALIEKEELLAHVS